MKILIHLILSLVLILSLSCCEPKPAPLEIAFVTDIHLAGREYHDYEGFFYETNEFNGSGKQMEYLDDIFDAFISEMKETKPDYLIISGDSTFTGAKVSHELFRQKLNPLREEGIVILTIPGNHDIVKHSFTYLDGTYQPTDVLSKDEYKEFYSDFGYGEAISQDDYSFSYVYDTGKGVRFFMLDTMIVQGIVYGQLSIGTMHWLEDELKACVEAGDSPIVAGHHNLLEHNARFNVSYRLGNCDDVEALLVKYGASLYLSGHLHTQHIVQKENITDIVGGAFAVFPHNYGIIEYTPNEWVYSARATNVEKYAKSIECTDNNLLNYNEFGYNFFYKNAYSQSYNNLSSIITDDELLKKYADFTAKVNVAYFGGDFSDIDLSLSDNFINDTSGTRWNSYIKSILSNTESQLFCSYKKTE